MKHAILFISAALLLSSCTNTSSTQTTNNTYTNDQALSFECPYFNITLDSSWQVTSQSTSSLPSHLTVVNGANNLITISVSSYFRPLDETCNLASNNFVHDKKYITKAPSVERGVCLIKASENGVDSTLVMGRDNTNQILYSITYKGDRNLIKSVFKDLHGDKYIEALKTW